MVVDEPRFADPDGQHREAARLPKSSRIDDLCILDANQRFAAKAAQLKLDERGFWVKEEPVSGGEIRGVSSGEQYLTGDEIRLS